MGLFDFLKGGNIRLCANSIARQHTSFNGDFNKVIDFYKADFHRKSKGTNPRYIGALALLEMAENYVDLAVITLNTEAAPENTPINHTYQDFGEELTGYFRDTKLAENFITGSNR